MRTRAAAMRWRPQHEAWVQRQIWQEHHQAVKIRNLARHVPDAPARRVLDLGAGLGGLLVRLRQEGFRAVGIEYSLEHCRIARQRGWRYRLAVPLVNAAGEALPVASASVGVVLCYEVIEHAADPDRLLREIRRVLEPGGRAFVTVPNRWGLYDHHYHLPGINWLPRPIADWLVHRLGRHKEDRSAGHQSLSAMHYFSFGGFLGLCRRIGFTSTDVREDRPAAERLPPGVLWLAAGLGRVGLGGAFYRLYRRTIMDDWIFVLAPTDPAP